MKREIKFRAWDSISKRWDLGITLCVDNDFNSYKRHFVFLQYTGLKDKNGVEIYEGDVVYVAGTGLMKVVFICAAWALESSDELIFFNECEDIESVRGNIYENPKLLEDEKES